nr:hypothetical protein [Lachnospiraceae bacterium]
DHFTTIYMPVRDDIRSKAKIEQFEATLRIMEYQGVLDKLVKIDFPYFEDVDVSPCDLESSSLGEYTRNLLQGYGMNG